MQIDNYTLGIIWSIGSYTAGRFIFRHRNRYFLEQIQKYCSNSMYQQSGITGKPQYVLKTNVFTPNDLPGWTERMAEQRNIPILTDYKDFLRAYFELHSRLDYCVAYRRKDKQSKYMKLRLRVYGNYILIQSINSILNEQCGVGSKKVQWTNLNEKTAYLAYTAYDEITEIFNWLTGTPYCEEYWRDVDQKLKEPIKL